MVYNISYDLCNPGQKYKLLHDLIVQVSHDRWAHVLESTYIIQCDKSSKEIYEFLSSSLDKNDLVLISEINTNYYGCLKDEVWPYIKGLF